MAILIDPAAWRAQGRLWAHLVSDTSYDELHAFAEAHGLPRRGFERDHYDVPESALAALVAGGAEQVSSRALLQRLDAAGLRRRKSTSMARRAPGNALLRPPRLRVGDLVAVTGPAGPIPSERLEAGVARLRGWGLSVRVQPHTLDTEPLGYLAGTDADRAADFVGAWMDDDVVAVIAGRGGYGTQRILDLLDWKRLAEARPKILAGFSDITALHQAVASRLGLVTLHSPVTTSLGSATAESAEAMRSMLFDPGVIDLFADDPVRVLMPGIATGVLIGGNLALLSAEVGSSTVRPAKGGLVVLEEVDEDGYRIDRMLTQLLRAGWFEGVRGVVLGAFANCGDLVAVEAIVLDRLARLGVPIVSGFDLGHTASSRSVPLGVRATLDAAGGRRPSLALAEPPFR